MAVGGLLARQADGPQCGRLCGRAFSPCGKLLATISYDRTLRLWNLTNAPREEHVRRLPDIWRHAIAGPIRDYSSLPKECLWCDRYISTVPGCRGESTTRAVQNVATIKNTTATKGASAPNSAPHGSATPSQSLRNLGSQPNGCKACLIDRPRTSMPLGSLVPSPSSAAIARWLSPGNGPVADFAIGS